MKKLVILLSLLVFACSSDDNDRENQNNVPQEDTLIGSWELIEIYASDGGINQGQWNTVQEQFRYTYIFRTDNSMRWDDNYECDGLYENNPSDFLKINFDCTDSQFTGTYDMGFDSHHLILIPNPMNCDEGCKLKFKKINSN